MIWVVAGVLAVVGALGGFYLARYARRQALADALRILAQAGARDSRGPAVLDSGSLGTAARDIVALLGTRPKEKPCAACAGNTHGACKGGWVYLAARGACGCGCDLPAEYGR
jgi:hypothetical protein